MLIWKFLGHTISVKNFTSNNSSYFKSRNKQLCISVKNSMWITHLVALLKSQIRKLLFSFLIKNVIISIKCLILGSGIFFLCKSASEGNNGSFFQLHVVYSEFSYETIYSYSNLFPNVMVSSVPCIVTVNEN